MANTDLSRQRRFRSVLDIALTLSLVTLSVTMVWYLVTNGTSKRVVSASPPKSAANRPLPPLPEEPVSIDGALLMGNKDAKVVVIAFSDVQCPYCGTFARDTLPELETKFIKTGKILFAFRHFPLEQLHPSAQEAAQAIDCADKQGQAWPMHDRLFANQKGLNSAFISKTASDLGLKPAAFHACMTGPAAVRVAADMESGRALAVSGTPTFFIGTQQPDHRVKLVKRIPGAVPISEWERDLGEWFRETGSK